MKRETGVLATLGILLAVAPVSFTQDLQKQPALPAEILGPELIAWSQLQKPRPVPQPLPPPDRPDQQQPEQQQPGQPVNGQAGQPQQQPATQTFTGTIIKDGSKYVLKVSDNSVYQLDDQEKAKQYEGKQVKIAGSLDANSSTLHISSIELLS